MAKVLLIFAHPAFENSRVNSDLVEAAKGVEGVTFHDLYEAYPDFNIDIAREQALLLQHDVIVMQHPFFWYSTPAIIKEWLDLVLQHGWAYGSDGKALQGKTLLTAMTAGGNEEAYHPDGMNRFTVREFLRPIEQTALLCGMVYAPPFVVFSSLHLDSSICDRHAANYKAMLSAAVSGEIDWPKVSANHELFLPAIDSILPLSSDA